MLNYDKALESFENYIRQYDSTDDKIKLKIIHTFGVVECASYIAIHEKMNEELPMVLEEICELEKDKKKMLKINEQFSLPVDNICYIEKRGSYAHIYTESNVYKLRKSLSNIFDFMNSHFVYINKGTIVNMKYVNEYQKENIILKDGTVLYMSRGRRSEFMLSYLKYKEEI